MTMAGKSKNMGIGRSGCFGVNRPDKYRYSGFTLTEAIVVVVLVSLFVLLAQMNLLGLLTRNTFKAQAQEFVSTMQMAASSAGESNKRYEVIIDLTEQSYLLREITTPELSEILEEEIIVENFFSENCWASYIEFDDDTWTNDDVVKFRVGRSGWTYGGKIVFLDENDMPYSVVVNRISRIVKLQKGDIPLLIPKDPYEIQF